MQYIHEHIICIYELYKEKLKLYIYKHKYCYTLQMEKSWNRLNMLDKRVEIQFFIISKLQLIPLQLHTYEKYKGPQLKCRRTK